MARLCVVSSRKVVQRLSSFAEWSEAANRGAPRRADDTPVLVGQTGPRRRATRKELMALVEQQRARYAAHR
jgi:hypothetical protein